MNFSDALNEIKAGKTVTRTGWNGKDMFIFLVPGSTFEVNRAPLNKIFPMGQAVRYNPHIDIKSVDGKITPWLASQTDLMADDWEVFVPKPTTCTCGPGDE